MIGGGSPFGFFADADTLTGGSGADLFVTSETLIADSITDLVSGEDKIALALSDVLAEGDFVSNDARFTSGIGVTSGQDVDDRVVYDTSTGNLYFDSDGNGPTASMLLFNLQGAPTLLASDITVTQIEV